MRLWAVIRLRARSLMRRDAVERELEEELAFDRAQRGGGDFDGVRESCRELRGWVRLESLVMDLRRAGRRLAATPGFAALVVVELGLGVAAATAVFSLFNAVLLSPMPGITRGHGLVHLERSEGGTLLGDASYPDYLELREGSRGYTALAATSTFRLDVRTGSGTRTVGAELVSGNYFAALQLEAEAGRVLGPEDERTGFNHVAVISDGYWRKAMGGRQNAMGATLTANGTPLTVVGVAARGFRGASQMFEADVWVPITNQPQLAPMGGPANDCLTSRFCGWVTIFGRLAPGVNLQQAQAEADGVSARFGAARPKLRVRRYEVVGGLGSWSDDRAAEGRLLWLLLAGALVLAAMTCTSLGGMFLARMGARQQEAATQLALGAGRWRVARHYLLEAAWLGTAGTLAGGWVAGSLGRRLLWLAPPSVPHNLPLAIDARVWVFASGLGLICVLALAAAPAWLTARTGRLRENLPGGSSTAGRARLKVQRALLAGQTTLSLLLLIAAGLAARSLQLATAGEVPAAAGRMLLARVDTGHAGAGSGGTTFSRRRDAAFFERLRNNLTNQPGVEQVALSSCLAPSPCNRGPVFVAGNEPGEAEIRSREFLDVYTRPDINWVSPEYFGMYAVPLVAGRDFDAGDGAGTTLVCIVNQTLAARLWPGKPAVGQRLAWPQFAWNGNHDFTVVGVAADRRSRSLLESVAPTLYVAAGQVPFPAMWVTMRTRLATGKAASLLQTQVARLDARIPLENVHTLAEQVRRSLWQPLAIAGLAGAFGLAAVLLGAIGLFGTLAQVIEERRRELGIRMALGATSGDIVRMIAGTGLGPVLRGLGLGAVTAGLLEPGLRPWLYGVGPYDWTVWAGAALLLGVTAAMAACVAACRATQVTPMEALRCD